MVIQESGFVGFRILVWEYGGSGFGVQGWVQGYLGLKVQFLVNRVATESTLRPAWVLLPDTFWDVGYIAKTWCMAFACRLHGGRRGLCNNLWGMFSSCSVFFSI